MQPIFFLVSMLQLCALSIAASSFHDRSLPTPTHTVTLQHSVLTASQARDRQHHRRTHGRELAASPNPLELTPLYPGYGTHFAFLYVGSPPKRQAVIIDTGSSHTAFPCEGCNKCGKHVNPYFDPQQSSSAVVATCGKKGKDRCTLDEHYSEGSSWVAYKVQDRLFVGSNDPSSSMMQSGALYAVDYSFGCMTSVTGLFETQLADGILGLSRNPNTLPAVLRKQNVTSSGIFAICLETGNGILTLGGVDQTLHKKKEKIKYAKLVPGTEYWTVQLSRVTVGADDNSKSDFKVLNKGGVIFDSGSTDSVFPVALKSLFTKVIPEMNHIDKQNRFVSKRDLLNTLPPVAVDLVGVGGNSSKPKSVRLMLAPGEYITKVDPATNTYELSIFFDDKGGVILGANAMSGYNTIFDAEKGRVGFVLAKCRFEDYVFENEPVLTMPPTATPKEGEATNQQKRCENSAYSSCSAKCDKASPRLPYQANGSQYYDCNSDETKPCHEYCSRSNQVQRGVSPTCLNSFWTECSAECSQTRSVAYLNKKGACAHKEESRSCYTDQCPTKDGDILIFADAMFFYKSDANEERPWSKLYEEDIVQALSILFKIMPGNIDILVDPESSLTDLWAGTKLQFQIYLKLTDFLGSETKLYRKAEQIRKMLTSLDIGAWVVAELSRICDQLDKDAISRYSFLFSFDFEVRRAVVLPIGERHDPTEKIPVLDNSEARQQQMLVYFLVGGILAIALLAGIIIVVHYKLRAEYALLAKDKVLTGGRMAKTIWNRLRPKNKGKNKNELAREQAKDDAEARGLMSTSIHDDDDDLNEFM